MLNLLIALSPSFGWVIVGALSMIALELIGVLVWYAIDYIRNECNADCEEDFEG